MVGFFLPVTSQVYRGPVWYGMVWYQYGRSTIPVTSVVWYSSIPYYHTKPQHDVKTVELSHQRMKTKSVSHDVVTMKLTSRESKILICAL